MGASKLEAGPGLFDSCCRLLESEADGRRGIGASIESEADDLRGIGISRLEGGKRLRGMAPNMLGGLSSSEFIFFGVKWTTKESKSSKQKCQQAYARSVQHFLFDWTAAVTGESTTHLSIFSFGSVRQDNTLTREECYSRGRMML